jgi:hypothetical protein
MCELTKPNNAKPKTNEPKQFAKCVSPQNETKRNQKPMNVDNLGSKEWI